MDTEDKAVHAYKYRVCVCVCVRYTEAQRRSTQRLLSSRQRSKHAIQSLLRKRKLADFDTALPESQAVAKRLEEELGGRAQFTRFTSTRVQILTQKALLGASKSGFFLPNFELVDWCCLSFLLCPAPFAAAEHKIRHANRHTNFEHHTSSLPPPEIAVK